MTPKQFVGKRISLRFKLKVTIYDRKKIFKYYFNFSNKRLAGEGAVFAVSNLCQKIVIFVCGDSAKTAAFHRITLQDGKNN